MQSAPLRTATGLVAFAAFLPLAALAAPKPFVGPAGWDHTVGAVAAQSLPRAQETWKKSDGQQLIYLADGGLAYDDIVALVKKNITDNAIKTAVDKDRTCDGHRAHEVEMTFAPTIVHQIIIDNSPGVTKLTYTRPDGMAMNADATAALAAYCGP
ncbi:MAG: hypothetical protein JWO85_3474 [Candidatus Eremiobacteraeota bacterium]|jgi:hypothetical protein|nr:hypothetical protein [Candidatus Eremiobacteraeota bacterium]